MKRLSNRSLAALMLINFGIAGALWSTYFNAKPAFDVESRRVLSVEQKEVVLINVERIAALSGLLGWNRIESVSRGSAALVLIDIDRRPAAFDTAERYLQRSLAVSVGDPEQSNAVHEAYSRFQCVRDGKPGCESGS